MAGFDVGKWLQPAGVVFSQQRLALLEAGKEHCRM
jgi:hypothetical protein